jgi:3-hydroxyisobutyrate dehydrogenase-like beta-hydroxyacid dehydrogenase
MVGGTKENFDGANTYLSAMGKNIVHCGDVSSKLFFKFLKIKSGTSCKNCK